MNNREMMAEAARIIGTYNVATDMIGSNVYDWKNVIKEAQQLGWKWLAEYEKRQHPPEE